jgi:hypothetical protein
MSIPGFVAEFSEYRPVRSYRHTSGHTQGNTSNVVQPAQWKEGPGVHCVECRNGRRCEVCAFGPARQLCTPEGNPILECKGGGGCFLSTACTTARGLPDDCSELMTLRQFRDQYLAGTAVGRELIDRYYRIAPSICRTIESRPDRLAIHRFLFDELVQPSIRHICSGDYEGARLHYEAITLHLRDTLRRSS